MVHVQRSFYAPFPELVLHRSTTATTIVINSDHTLTAVVVELGGVNTPNNATVKAMEYFRQFAKCGNRF